MHSLFLKVLQIQYMQILHIFDGMSIAQGVGKPSKCRTFGEYAHVLSNIVFQNKYRAHRIDVVFDNYREYLIKKVTRQKRGKNTDILRVIESTNTLLPQ